MRHRAKNVLTVEQTAEVLGIGRQTAYAECRVFLLTDRRKGIEPPWEPWRLSTLEG